MGEEGASEDEQKVDIQKYPNLAQNGGNLKITGTLVIINDNEPFSGIPVCFACYLTKDNRSTDRLHQRLTLGLRAPEFPKET